MTKAELEQQVKQLKEQVESVVHGTIIEGCHITQEVNYDRDISDAVLTVATGLTNLTKLFNSQNITMGPAMHITQKDADLTGDVEK